MRTGPVPTRGARGRDVEATHTVTTPAARGRLGPWPGRPARGVGRRHRRWSRVRLALDPCARPHGEAPPAAPASWEPPWDGRACGPGQAGARRMSADKAAVMSWWLQSQYEERLAGAAGATQPPVWLSPGSGHPPAVLRRESAGDEPRLCAPPLRTPGYLWKQTLEATRRGFVSYPA